MSGDRRPIRVGPHDISVAILAKDEGERIGRCLDSLTQSGFTDVLVLDSGSRDCTVVEAAARGAFGVSVTASAWGDSFARARNAALDLVGREWVLFVDADEWVKEGDAAGVARFLSDHSPTSRREDQVFAPIIQDLERRSAVSDVARMMMAKSGIRFRGRVHEYPCRPDTTRPSPHELPLTLLHDGYREEVVGAKQRRNVRLLRMQAAEEPENPRWWYFLLRDNLWDTGSDEIAEILASVRRSTAERGARTNDTGAEAPDYLRTALVQACERLFQLHDHAHLLSLCDEIDETSGGACLDSDYFRALVRIERGSTDEELLARSITRRADPDRQFSSILDPSMRHYDAVIAALLNDLRSSSEANDYLQQCSPWTDAAFEASVLRGWHEPSARQEHPARPALALRDA